jgi:elongation factor Ts
MVSIDKIKKLREETSISITECKKALEKAGGDMGKAKEILKKIEKSFSEKKKEREAKEGIVESYIHPGKKVGVMIELNCESDFVARSEDFQKLAHELCLQIAAIDPEEIPILEQPWIRDENIIIKDLIEDYIVKLGENIVLKKYVRYEI